MAAAPTTPPVSYDIFRMHSYANDCVFLCLGIFLCLGLRSPIFAAIEPK